MSERRHAEVVGAGVGGLVAAIALANRGWSVCVHERAPTLRTFGTGITCWPNFVRVLEAVETLDLVRMRHHPFARRETRDHRGRTLYAFGAPAGDRAMTVARRDLLEALAATACAVGVRIVTESNVIAATPDGDIFLQNGERRTASLVVAADGVNSRVRESLNMPTKRRALGQGAFRALVPRSLDDRRRQDRDLDLEYWCGRRRIFCVPCNDDELYLSMLTHTADREGAADPLDRAAWIGSFPGLERLIANIGENVRWDTFEEVRLKNWSRGKVAFVGDAATAMAPNIGQGGATAAMNALSLAVHATTTGPLEGALQRWERKERALSEHTQAVSYWYGRLNDLPPTMRIAVIRLGDKSAKLRRIRQRAAFHVPTGCRP